MTTTYETVFTLWCRLTGVNSADINVEQRAAFLTHPHVAELAAAPYPELLDAAIATADRGTLPLDRWLGNLRQLART